MDIIVVVLGADTKNQRTLDSIKIINYIYNNFEYVDISDYTNQSFEIYKKNYQENVFLDKTRTIPDIELKENINEVFPLKINTSYLLSTKFYGINILNSGIKQNQKIGCMTVYYDKKILTNIDVILKNDLYSNTWDYYFLEILKKLNFSFLN